MKCLPQQAMAMEPLVFHGEWLYVPGRSGQAEAFISVGHKRLGLRRLSMRVYREERARTLGPIVLDQLQTALHTRQAATCTDPIAYYLWLKNAAADGAAGPDNGRGEPRTCPRTAGPDPLSGFADLLSQLPPPQLPNPSLILLGLVWPLEQQACTRNRLQVRVGEAVFGIAGRPRQLARLDEAYQTEVNRFVESAADRLARETPDLRFTSAELNQARTTLKRDGYLQYGSLILIAGPPLLIGYLIPAHYNNSLGRQVNGDVAITAPFTLPAVFNLQQIGVHECFSTGQWRPTQLPHGLCWGRVSAPAAECGGDPGPDLSECVRFLGYRIAQNQKFHTAG